MAKKVTIELVDDISGASGATTTQFDGIDYEIDLRRRSGTTGSASTRLRPTTPNTLRAKGYWLMLANRGARQSGLANCAGGRKRRTL